MRVLIIEDNKILSKNINKFLELNWINSEFSYTWKEGLYLALTQNYDCIILDLNLGDIDWLDICFQLRKKQKTTPILILSARNTLQDKIKWLQIWWDDYLTKPFEYEELLARIHSLIRRNDTIKSNIIIIDNIKIDTNSKRIYKNNIEIKLTSLEYNLFTYLAKHQWQILSKEILLEKVWWNLETYSLSRTVDVYISYLRKKIDKDIIKTKKGLWYIIE